MGSLDISRDQNGISIRFSSQNSSQKISIELGPCAVTNQERFRINNLVYVALNLLKSLFWDLAPILYGCGDRHGDGSLARAMMKKQNYKNHQVMNI